MPRLKLIVNPTSGQEAAVDALPLLNGRLREHFDVVDIALTVEDGDAERAAVRAFDDGYSHVVAVGGDGTLNQVVNGIGSCPGGFESTLLGVLPLGTGNDFARGLGLPAGAEELVGRLRPDRVAVVDVVTVDGRFFVNTSAGGFVADTSERIPSELKTVAGRLAYLIGGAQALANYESVVFRATSGGRTVLEGDFQTFIVCNSQYIGGGHHVAPQARVDDGLLDLCVVNATGMVNLITLLARLSRGEAAGADEVTFVKLPDVSFEFDRPTMINTDGERPHEVTRCDYRVLPGVARFMV